jgi:hypothetical protein
LVVQSQTDAVVGWVEPRQGRAFAKDTFVSGYAAPRADDRQDLGAVSGRLDDGFASLSFVRKRDTGDPKVRSISNLLPPDVTWFSLF